MTVGASFTDNTIDGSNTAGYATVEGYSVWNTPTTGSVLISGGTVSGVDTGVWVTTYDNSYLANADDTQATVDNVNITASDTGVWVDASPLNTINSTAMATIEGNTISTGGAGTGILVAGTSAAATAIISGGTIDDNQTGIEFQSGGSGSVDGVNFDPVIPIQNVTDLAIDSGAGTVTVGATTPNAFDASGTYIDNTSSQYIDATNNTFGGVDPATASLSQLYAIQDQIIDALDNESYGLVRIVADNVYVTQDNELDNNNSTQDAIQRGIDAASDNDTVNVQAGIYQANSAGNPGGLDVNKPVNLSGDGSSQVAVYPSISNIGTPSGGAGTELGSATTLVLVEANDVRIHGFTFDGANPNLIVQGTLVDGAYINARNGILTNFNLPTPITNLEIDHNTVQNIYLRGIAVETDYGTFNIHDNSVSNVQGDPDSAVAIFNFGGSGSITNNTVSGASDAISANWSLGTEFAYNTISDSASGIHTDNSDGFGGGTPDSIHNNTVENGPIGSYGIWVFVPYDTISIANNTVTNVSVGLALFGGAGGSASFTGNSVTGNLDPNGAGYYQTDDQLGYGTGDDSAVFDDNTISNSVVGVDLVQTDPTMTSALSMTGGSISGATNSGAGVGIDLIGGSTTITGVSVSSSDTGVYVDGSTYSASVTFGAGNSITDGTTGLVLNGSGTSVVGNSLNDMTFTGQTGNYITLASERLGRRDPNHARRHRRHFRRLPRRHWHASGRPRHVLRYRRQDHRLPRRLHARLCQPQCHQRLCRPTQRANERWRAPARDQRRAQRRYGQRPGRSNRLRRQFDRKSRRLVHRRALDAAGSAGRRRSAPRPFRAREHDRAGSVGSGPVRRYRG